MTPDKAIYTAYEDFTPWDTAGPERRLMMAILRTAMDDVRKSGEVYREAREYLLSNDDYYVFSFLSICRHLSVCPLTVRRVCGLMPRERQALAA